MEEGSRLIDIAKQPLFYAFKRSETKAMVLTVLVKLQAASIHEYAPLAKMEVAELNHSPNFAGGLPALRRLRRHVRRMNGLMGGHDHLRER